MNGEELEIGQSLTKGVTVDLVVGEGETGDMVNIPILIGLNIEEASKAAEPHWSQSGCISLS